MLTAMFLPSHCRRFRRVAKRGCWTWLSVGAAVRFGFGSEGMASKGGGHPARASATVKKSTESNISAAFSGTDIALTLRGIEMNAAFYDD
ncbi:MAG: hypothetical protein ACREXG_03320 [Polaromonas sp.]